VGYIPNRDCSQWAGREELFERERETHLDFNVRLAQWRCEPVEPWGIFGIDGSSRCCNHSWWSVWNEPRHRPKSRQGPCLSGI